MILILFYFLNTCCQPVRRCWTLSETKIAQHFQKLMYNQESDTHIASWAKNIAIGPNRGQSAWVCLKMRDTWGYQDNYLKSAILMGEGWFLGPIFIQTLRLISKQPSMPLGSEKDPQKLSQTRCRWRSSRLAHWSQGHCSVEVCGGNSLFHD